MSEFEDVFNSKKLNKEETEKLSRFARERQLDDISWMLNDERGRRFIWRFLNICGVFEFLFIGDPLQDARINGKQTVGSIIQKDVIEVGGFKVLDVMDREDEAFMAKEKEAEDGK